MLKTTYQADTDYTSQPFAATGPPRSWQLLLVSTVSQCVGLEDPVIKSAGTMRPFICDAEV